MSRSKSSERWLKEHFADPFVKQAQQDGYRSRAAYKLLELQGKDKLFKSAMTVIDLGAAPGGWSQVAAQIVGVKGQIIALDILPMPALKGVTFIQGNFLELAIFEQLVQLLPENNVDIVMSDMSPNMCGLKAVDQPRAMYMAELALDFAQHVLKPQGSLLLKVFQGQGFEQFLKILRQIFTQVLIRKPDASRTRSAEVYLLAKGYKVY